MDIASTATRHDDFLRGHFRDGVERRAIDCASLWWRRALAVDQPHCTVPKLAILEQRLDAQFEVLMGSLDLGWQVCAAALDAQQPGEVFTAAVVALRSHDVAKIQTALDAGLAIPATFKGLVSALGWLPASISRPWIERLLKGKDMNHKYLGVAACSVRRDNPGDILNHILQREDCKTHAPLHARALRLIGELRRHDLLPALQATLNAKDTTLVFWATWSSILLGQRSLVNHLYPFVAKPGPYQARALQLAFRLLPVGEAREWISALAQDPANVRTVIQAAGVLGDPHAVNGLIARMAEPEQARVAGESFTFITGIDLNQYNLTAPRPSGFVAGPNDDPNDNYVGLDEDENLPWPDAGKIAAQWRQHGPHFLAGRRYFLGKAITPAWLKQKLADGAQRQRHAAALELALTDSQSLLVNTCAKVIA